MSQKFIVNLSVIGDKSERERFKNEVDGGDEGCLIQNNPMPVPSGEEIEKLYGSSNTMLWRLDNWGNSGEILSDNLEEKEDRLIYATFSGTYPPIKWLAEISKQFATLTFELWYMDEYMDEEQGATIIVCNGKIEKKNKQLIN